MSKKITNEEFLKFIEDHKIPVTPLEEYQGWNVNILCRCNICGYEWKIRPNNLKTGKGCPKCALKRISKKNSLTQEEFLLKLHKNSPNIIPLQPYTTGDKKIKLKCKICGCEWFARPYDLIKSNNFTGCPKCANYRQWNAENFVVAMQNINPEIEILSPYIKNTQKVKCRCKICGHIWEATPKDLKRHQGCPICKSSKGERKINQILKQLNIEYEREKKFADCKLKRPLRFDFYLPKYNLCIEYDGEQHFNIRKYLSFGKPEEEANKLLAITQKRDKIKNEYCKKNNINLLRIPYWKFSDIENIIKEKIDSISKNIEGGDT